MPSTLPSLRTVTRTSGANAAIKDGSVRPAGFTLSFEEVPVLVRAFRTMVRELNYDVCEMAVTTYLCAREHGVAFTALPIFLVRGLHHAAVVRHVAAGIQSPKDLEGRRVGVNRGYTVTTGVWARAVLAEEHGVDLESVTWVRSGDEHVAEYQPPANVVDLDSDKDLTELVAGGELPAAVNIDTDSPDVTPLIDDATEAAFAALRERGLYPINHLVVVRNELLEQYPDLAPALVEAFTVAKNQYVERLGNDGITAPTATDQLYRRVLETIAGDPLPYGIDANRGVLQTLMRYAVDQRILAAPVPVESLFAAGTTAG